MNKVLHVEAEVFEQIERARRAFEAAGLVNPALGEEGRRNATLGILLEIAGERRPRATPEAWARREKARDVLRLLNDGHA